MANYNSWIRTNYFEIEDESKWAPFMEKLKKGSDDIEDFSEGRQHAFGGTGYIGFKITKDNNTDKAFQNALQDLVAEDDAVIIEEVGHEKLNYLAAGATVITKHSVKTIDLSEMVKDTARKLLDDIDWDTQLDY
ncbi:MAG: hypothetical protein LUE86_14010 [Clostridiales bacterium]|nr:hypothetical protein [Clostridiales bacterium]